MIDNFFFLLVLLGDLVTLTQTSLVAQMVKCLPTTWETQKQQNRKH